MGLTTLELLRELRPAWRAQGLRVVLTNGVFDLLHVGHVTYLEQARALGDLLVVALNSDASARAHKGPQHPLVPELARVQVVAALRPVDYVTLFNERTAEAVVTALHPDIYVKGGDYAQHGTTTIDESRLPEARVVRSYGGEVRLLPYQDGFSTSALIARIRQIYGTAAASTGDTHQ
jgi:rfaE bifunctional protein nucleotidyltransferase chain/domain